MTYDRILVPTDGSDPAERALERAGDLARTFDATLRALYVVDTAAYSGFDVRSDVVIDTLEEEAEAVIARAKAVAADADVALETDVRHGNPAREIVDCVRAEGVDLVVMGTHGRRGLNRLLLGSVAERVVRSSPADVLTVRADGAE